MPLLPLPSKFISNNLIRPFVNKIKEFFFFRFARFCSYVSADEGKVTKLSITKFMYNNIVRFSSDSFSDCSKGKREHVVLNFGNGFSSSLH